MNCKIFAAMLICWTVSVSALALGDEAKDLRPSDFAYGRTIDGPAGSAAYRFPLPEEIYQGVARDDLGDIRVFNAKEEIVPYELSRIRTSTREVATQEQLPLFRIEGNPGVSTSENRVSISEDSSGKVIAVRFSGKEKTKEGPTSYLLDARKFTKSVHALDFEWTAAQGNQIIPLTVEESSDLNSWRLLTNGSVLARFSYAQETIEQGRIEFPARRITFLRITVPAAAKVSITKALASFTEGEVVAPSKNWTELSGVIDSERSARFLFDAKSPLPVSAIRLTLPELNTLVRVVISSRSNDRGAWTPRFTGVVYHLSMNNQTITSPSHELQSVVNDRLWAVEISGKDAKIGSAAPALLLGWVPHEMTFLARGSGPFKLAYGNIAVKNPDFGVSSISSFVTDSSGQGLSPATATLADVVELGGKSKLVAPQAPPPPLPWKKWILWGVLTLFLLGLGYMTWKLGMNLKDTSNP